MSKDNNSLSLKTISPWILLFLGWSNLPYLLAWLRPPAGKQFVGTFVNQDDLSTYLSAIRQGAAGNWLYHFQYSPEPWQPKLMLLPYLLTGKLAALLGGSPLFWFHLLRITTGSFTLVILCWWVRIVFPQRPQWQRTGWLLIVFGSGLGWLVATLQGPGHPGPLIADLTIPEWSVFMALFHTPHFALGVGLELLFFICILKLFGGESAPNTMTKNKTLWAMLTALVGFASGLTYAYHLPVIGLVSGIFLLWRAGQQRQVLWREWLLGGVVMLPMAALLLYYGIFANRDPYFAAYARFQNVIQPPAPLAIVIGAGLLGFLAILAVPRWLQQGKTPLVPLWLGLNLVLLYLPIVQQRGRFGLGLMVPVATLAAWYLEDAVLPWLALRPFYPRFSRFTPTPYASLRRVWLAAVLPSTLLIPLLLSKTAVTTKDFPIYIANQEVQAAEWLGQHSQTDDLVLASYTMGNYLPRAIPGKLFLGQLDLTTDLTGKLALLDQFWATETTSAWREAFLQEWGIDFIYVGQYEQALGPQPVELPGSIIFQNDTVAIYRIDLALSFSD